jgi:imidazolonepropionase
MKLLLNHIGELVTLETPAGVRRGSEMSGRLGIIEDGAVLIEDGFIQWLGVSKDVPNQTFDKVLQLSGKTVTPGLIDAHTHIIFAGDRAVEYTMRAAGKSYQDIEAAGGGIAKSVRQVAEAGEGELLLQTAKRLRAAFMLGVSTMEVKSGYGLDLPNELKLLRAVKKLNGMQPITLVPTFLAHAVPAAFKDNRNAYIEMLCTEMIPAIVKERLAVFCDVFCDDGAFTASEAQRILQAGISAGLKPRIHTDEFASIGGSQVASQLKCSSADHLLKLTDDGISDLLIGDVVAGILPGTSFFLGLPHANARKMIDAGLPVTLATDCNPGSCMTENLPLMMSIACSQLKLTPAEALVAVTINAARSLGLEKETGSIEVGKRADIAVFDVPSYTHLAYHVGINSCIQHIKDGKLFTLANGI